ncbi:MAG: hypothetical protein EPN84_12485 [Legionella sp.]|nr:MAG: hypothetical protein EPN84_12485 [Legionella sp.]
MSLFDELYLQNTNETLAEKIDRAWGIYRDSQVSKDKRTALNFLMYVFNIENLNDVNEQLIKLMADRAKHKDENPEYIPTLSPSYLELTPGEMRPAVTKKSKESEDYRLQALFDAGEILDVSNNYKSSDPENKVPMLFAPSRAKFRVHIFRGQFYQNGKLFNTESMTSHPNGYASFTLNANGELSVFNHFRHKRINNDYFAHSSMNAGSPLVSAGELHIKDGKLLMMSTGSGHYRPTLLSIYRTLQYFSQKGIDVSETEILTFTNPANRMRVSKSKMIQVTNVNYYVISATELIKNIDSILDEAALKINHDLELYQDNTFWNFIYHVKDWLTGSNLTGEREKLAKTMKTLVNELHQQLQNTKSNRLDLLSETIDRVREINANNKKLSKEHGKSTFKGRLNQIIMTFEDDLLSIRRISSSSDIKLENLRQVF